MTLPRPPAAPRPGSGADTSGQLMLRFGELHECGLRARDRLLSTARSRLEDTVFTIEGMSGLRFLLEPGTVTMHTAGLVGGTIDPADRAAAEAVAAAGSLRDPASWWEALAWTDGPSLAQVRQATAHVCYVGVGADGLGEPGVSYPVAYLQRAYSPEAFALYAVATNAAGRTILTRAGAPELPAPTETTPPSDSYRAAHTWLGERDLSWLTSGHPVTDLLGTYLRLFPSWLRDHRDLRDLLGGLDRLLPAVATAHLY